MSNRSRLAFDVAPNLCVLSVSFNAAALTNVSFMSAPMVFGSRHFEKLLGKYSGAHKQTVQLFGTKMRKGEPQDGYLLAYFQ